MPREVRNKGELYTVEVQYIICKVLYVNPIYVVVYIFAVNYIVYVLGIYTFYFSYEPICVPPCQSLWYQWSYCVSVFASSFVHLSTSLSLSFLLHSETWLWHCIYSQEKPRVLCHKHNHNQTITSDVWGYRASLAVCLYFT